MRLPKSCTRWASGHQTQQERQQERQEAGRRGPGRQRTQVMKAEGRVPAEGGDCGIAAAGGLAPGWRRHPPACARAACPWCPGSWARRTCSGRRPPRPPAQSAGTGSRRSAPRQAGCRAASRCPRGSAAREGWVGRGRLQTRTANSGSPKCCTKHGLCAGAGGPAPSPTTTLWSAFPGSAPTSPLPASCHFCVSQFGSQLLFSRRAKFPLLRASMIKPAGRGGQEGQDCLDFRLIAPACDCQCAHVWHTAQTHQHFQEPPLLPL